MEIQCFEHLSCKREDINELMIKVKAQADLYIIQVYFPTSSSTEEELDDMYEQLEDLMSNR